MGTDGLDPTITLPNIIHMLHHKHLKPTDVVKPDILNPELEICHDPACFKTQRSQNLIITDPSPKCPVVFLAPCPRLQRKTIDHLWNALQCAYRANTSVHDAANMVWTAQDLTSGYRLWTPALLLQLNVPNSM
ncbi:hypothetical protein AMECASPLE_039005 [Ameca splendens]|uniref:Uncharacterized protein n=1 Tax=Ameca splendens TaxID=208324 RepID=A0ABV0YJQ0_9TELE